VEQRRPADQVDAAGREPQPLRGGPGELRDAGGMTQGERREQIDHVGEGSKHMIQPRPGDPASGSRLRLQHLGPHVHPGQAPEQVRPNLLERRCHGGVEPSSGAPPHHRHGRVRAAEPVEDHGLRCERGETSR
jgi:hypothetical protein